MAIGGVVIAAQLLAVGCSRTPRDPVGHSVKVHEKPWRNDIAPSASVVQVSGLPEGPRNATVTHGDNVAFLIRNPKAETSVLDQSVQLDTVYYVAEGKCFRIDGIPLGKRPITGLAWCNGRFLQFDRNYQPGFGIHYLVDTKERKVVNTSPFPESVAASQPASKPAK